MQQGWVSVHRKLLDNPIFKNHKLLSVFMYCLLKASHTERDQLVGDCIVKLKAGELATGRKAISSATGLTEQNTKTALNKLKALSILTIKPTNKYSIISIVNWDSYQQTNQQVTSKQPASNQQVTTNNNDNKGNNGNNINYQLIADAWNSVFPELPKVVSISQKRKSHINACAKEFGKSHGLSDPSRWEPLFVYASKSDFLTGRKSDFSMTFDWVINKSNLLKIIEGNYENAQSAI